MLVPVNLPPPSPNVETIEPVVGSIFITLFLLFKTTILPSESTTISSGTSSILSDDISLPYLLKKPSCTQFFIPAHILIGWNENKFIDQMNKSNPNFILYSSPITMLTNKKNMPKVDLFIKNNYYLFRDFMGWKIYEKKKNF